MILSSGDWRCGRAVFKLKVEDQPQRLHFNDPTAVALGSLIGASPYNGPMRDGFAKEGGAPTLVLMLRESTCVVRLGYTLELISGLLWDVGPPSTRNWRREAVNAFFDAGG